MLEDPVVRLAAALAAAPAGSERFATAQQLAAHLRASALLMLVEDPVVAAYVPVPGFPQTLPGGAGWLAFLASARESEVYHGRVGYPTAGDVVSATAFTSHGLMLVLLGNDFAPEGVETLRSLVPFLAACLRSEHAAVVAKGELLAAREHAGHVETLAHALDGARAEVERTVRSLERQARATDIAKARAEEATRAKDEFLAMLGHELRNPLTPIVTALHLLRLKQSSSRELDIIDRQVAALSRLVEDLLDVSRITTGKIELRKEEVEVSAVAARAIEMSSPVLEKKHQVLSVRIAPAGLRLYADPSRLAQVFANLLTNAAKYSDARTTITFAAERDGEAIRIRVQDQGVGLAPGMTDRIFDLFVQQRQAVDRAQGGLGLGLAIVRSLVALHDGSITAHSDGEGCGSEFVVTLPCAAPAAVPHPAGDDVMGSACGLAHARVLVVDDNDDATSLLADVLTACGHTVRTAADGPAALRIASEFRPQVAILDIGLPVMDGYELAGRLQAADGDHAVLIAMTGYGQAQDIARSMAAGFHAHLTKPVSINDLQTLVASLALRT